MSYNKTLWKTGDIISSINLNKMQQGIADGQELFIIEIQPTDAPEGAGNEGTETRGGTLKLGGASSANSDPDVRLAYFTLTTSFEDIAEAYNEGKICYLKFKSDAPNVVIFAAIQSLDTENRTFLTEQIYGFNDSQYHVTMFIYDPSLQLVVGREVLKDLISQQSALYLTRDMLRTNNYQKILSLFNNNSTPVALYYWCVYGAFQIIPDSIVINSTTGNIDSFRTEFLIDHYITINQKEQVAITSYQWDGTDITAIKKIVTVQSFPPDY